MKIKIKKGFRDKTLVSFTTRAGIFAALFVLFSSSVFANSFRYTQTAKMDEEQTHYYKVILNDETTANTHLFTFDFDALKNDQLTFNLPDGSVHIFDEGKTTVTFGSRTGWVGLKDGGEAHLIPHHRKQMLTGTIYLLDQTYAIRSLGKGLQVLITITTEDLELCGNHNIDATSDAGAPYIPTEEIDGTEESNVSNMTLTDECYIRVLVAYTEPVGAAEADPIALIMDGISQSNQAYNNSGVNQQLLLARVYETPYDDTGIAQGTVLSAWRATADGNMDEVHTQRSLYRADMCALITSVGSGIAYTGVSAANAFSCTNRTRISTLTFQHELGHNHSCQHDPVNYGGGSNYRGFGNPSGIFRTVMAYQSACGTGTCGRVNEFSGVTNTYTTGGTTYSTGNSTQNNVSGHNNNNGTIVGYQSIITSGFYAGDYDYPDDEYANFAAEDTLRYLGSGTNKMEYESGSEGSFVAGHRIRLQKGFHAKSGSSFRAYIDPNCTVISVSGEPPVTEFEGGQTPNEVHGNHNHKNHNHDFGIEKIEAFPNPFSGSATIQYSVKEDGPVAVSVFDINGKQVTNLVNSSNHSSGEHQVIFDGNKLPSGMYHCRMITKDGVKVIALSLSR